MANANHTKPVEPGGSLLGHLLSSLSAMFVLVVICCGLYPLLVWGIAQGVFPNQANGSLLTKDGKPTVKDDDAVGSALLGQPFLLRGYFHPRPSEAGNSAGPTFAATGGYDPTSSGGTNYGPLNDGLLNGATTQPSAPTTPTAAAASPSPATAPASTQPAEVLSYDGVRLRTLHYAVDNGLTFKLRKGGVEVPLAQFRNADGSLNDTALVDAFPHPTSDAGLTGLTADSFAGPDGKPVEIPADAVTASASGLDPHISPDNAALQAQRVADARKVSVDKVTALITQYTDKPDLGILGDPGVNVLRLNLALDVKYPLPATPTTQPAK
jgi:K+-transporting ATPase ATPase C chain